MINLFKLDEMLEAGKGKEYTTMEALKKYKEEFDRIVEERKKEFDSLPPNWKTRFSEDNFNYKNALKMKQTYIINGGEATIETNEFPLPISENIFVTGVTIYSDADISGYDKSWEIVRKKIAEKSGNPEITATDNGDIFTKYVQYPKNIMDDIFNVRKAGILLKNSKKNEAERILALGYVADGLLRPVAVK